VDKLRKLILCLSPFLLLFVCAALPEPGSVYIATVCGIGPPGTAWPQHLIHQSTLRGSDGQKLADFNGDGNKEVVSSWEQSGVTTLSLHPGCGSAVRNAANWATAEIASQPANEGACIADFDLDGRLDIATMSQGGSAPIVKFGPALNSDLLDPSDWATMTLTAYSGLGIGWMTCAGADITGDGHIDLILGGETGGVTGELTYVTGPSTSKRTAAGWTPRTTIEQSARIMTLIARDIDGDTDIDLLASTRGGANTGVFWQQNNGTGTFTRRNISQSIVAHGNGHVFMLFRPGDIDNDGDDDICASTDAQVLRCMENRDSSGNTTGDWLAWSQTFLPHPAPFGNYSAAAIADVNLDTYPDVIVSSFDAAPTTTSGLVVMYGPNWARGEIEGLTHTVISKWDEIEIDDVDCDGDLDVIAGNSGDEDGIVEGTEALWWFENLCLN